MNSGGEDLWCTAVNISRGFTAFDSRKVFPLCSRLRLGGRAVGRLWGDSEAYNYLPIS